MKKLYYAVVILAFVALNLNAVYHKISHYSTENYCVDEELVNNNLFVLTTDQLNVLNVNNPENPVLISNISTESQAFDLLIHDNYAYISTMNNIQIYDISDPNNLALSSTIPISFCVSLSISNNKLFALKDTDNQQSQFYSINISNPATPAIESSFVYPGKPVSFQVLWPVAFFQPYDNNLKVLNIEDFDNVQLLNTLPSGGDHFLINSNVLYLDSGENGTSIYDISNPLDNVPLITSVNCGEPFAISGDKLYSSHQGIEVSQINNDFEITNEGNYFSDHQITKFIVSNDLAYEISDSGLNIYDLSNPTEDECIGSCDLPQNATNIESNNGTYLINYTDGITYSRILNLDPPQNPTSIEIPNQSETNPLQFVTCNSNFLFAYNNSSIVSYDFSNPLNPILTSSLDVTSAPQFMNASNNQLIVINIDTINLYSIGENGELTETAQINSSGVKTACTFKYGYPFYAVYGQGIKLFNLNTLSEVPVYSIDERVNDLSTDSGILSVSTDNGLLLLDVSDLNSVQLISTIKPHDDSAISSSIILDDHSIVADKNWNEILSYDVSDPNSPILLNSYKGNREVKFMKLGYGNQIMTLNTVSGFALMDNVIVTHNDDNNVNHTNFQLKNYPNPFYSGSSKRGNGTTISFSTPSNSNVTLNIYDIKGRKITTLTNRKYSKGQHTIIWNGKDRFGKNVSSGVYFYRLKCDNNSITKKMLLLK